MSSSSFSVIEECHRAATCNGQKTYVDPQTGYNVFTAKTLLGKFICCGNDCRHCPYAHFNVSANRRVQSISHSMLLYSNKCRFADDSSNDVVDLIFYDGSLKSLKSVACYTRIKSNDNITMLISTYNAKTTRLVNNDKLDYYDIFSHSKLLKMSLMMIRAPENGEILSREIDDTIESSLGGKRVVNLIADSCDMSWYDGKHNVIQVDSSIGEEILNQSVMKLILP